MIFGRKRTADPRPVSPPSGDALRAREAAESALRDANRLADRGAEANARIRAVAADEVAELLFKLITAQPPTTGNTDGR